MTGHGNLAGVPPFFREMKKEGILPIAGQEFYVCDEPLRKDKSNKSLTHLCVLARDRDGWGRLLRATGTANQPEFFYHKPRLSLEHLANVSDGRLVCFSGHLGSHMADVLFKEPKEAYRCKTVSQAESLLREDWEAHAEQMLGRFVGLFGRGNFFLEIQLIDGEYLPAAVAVAERLRHLAKKRNVPPLATSDSHYPTREDSADQRILLCSRLKSSLQTVMNKMDNDEEVGLEAFFRSDNYHIPSYEEMAALHTQEELLNAVRIAESCSDYSLSRPPLIPRFYSGKEGGRSSDEGLRQLCRGGWVKKIKGVIPPGGPQDVYTDRIKMELEVLGKAKLPDYFLIVHDYAEYARNELGAIVGERGCLLPDTEIVIPGKGHKKISDMQEGDEVYTRDGSTQRVQKVWEYDCREEIIELSVAYNKKPLRLTKDHLVLVEKGRTVKRFPQGKQKGYKVLASPTGEASWVEACRIEPGDWVFVPHIQYRRPVDLVFDLGRFCTCEELVADGDKVRQLRKNWYTLRNEGRYAERYFTLDEEWAYVCGVFAGDGSLCSEKNYLANITFGVNDKESMRRVSACLSRVFNSLHEYEQENQSVVQLTINSRFAYELFRYWFPRYQFTPATKHVPEWVRHSVAFARAFLDGYIAADGDKRETREEASITKTVSKDLADGVYELSLWAGIPVTYTGYQPKDPRPEFSNLQYTYCLYHPVRRSQAESSARCEYRETPFGIMLRVRSVDTAVHVGKVYDLQVENNHNYLTRQGVVHNSAAGCLVSYLSGITEIDPVRYGLIFERFYNAGRMSDKGASTPDIDLDFPPECLDRLFEYLRDKYGHDRVARMATFSRIQGRAALSEVLRAHSRCSYAEMKEITAPIPDESKISDDLQAALEEYERGESDHEPSIIRWALENEGPSLSRWARLTEDGEVTGPLARDFEQAMRLEGIYKSRSTHASGVIICSEPLEEACPMIYDPKSGDRIVGVDMRDAEEMGLVKFDLLSSRVQTKIQQAINMARTGSLT